MLMGIESHSQRKPESVAERIATPEVTLADLRQASADRAVEALSERQRAKGQKANSRQYIEMASTTP